MQLFQHPELLEEMPSIDQLDQEREVQSITQKIDGLVKRKTNVIIAYVGPFGSGKSSALKSVQAKRAKYDWINFDLWRYSDRNKIWDGFVAEVAAELKHGSNSLENEIQVIDEIEGEQTGFFNWLRKHRLFLLISIPVLWFVVSLPVWNWLHPATTLRTRFLEALLKYALPTLFILLALVGIDNVFPKSQRPLRRIFELEEYLRRVLNNLKKPLVIVVEDVDRTGEEGIVFLETLQSFLKRDGTKPPKPIIVIAPQDKTAFDVVNNNNLNGFQRSLKLYDFEVYQADSTSWVDGIGGYLDALGIDALYKAQLEMTIEEIARSFPQQVTIRLVKRLLRTVDEFVKTRPDANPATAFCCCMLNFIVVKGQYSQHEETVWGLLRRRSTIESPPALPFAHVLMRLANADEGIRDFSLDFEQQDKDIKVDVVTHPIGEKTASLSVNAKYKALM